MSAIRWLAAIVVASILVTGVAAGAGQSRVLAKTTTKFSLATLFIVSSDDNGSFRRFGYRVTTAPARQKVKLAWSWDCSGKVDDKGKVVRATPYTIWKPIPEPSSECGASAVANRPYGAAGNMTVQILGR